MMMQLLISEASREVSRSYAVDGRFRSPETPRHDEPQRPRRGIERDPNRKGKNGRFLGSPFPFSGSSVISLSHHICISEGRGRARSWATPRPSRRGRPPRNSSPPRKLDWGLAVENRRGRLIPPGPEGPVRRGWRQRSSRAGAARVRVEVTVGGESSARVVRAFSGQKESRESLFTLKHCLACCR
jgi:hypothetical protein